MTRIIMKLDEQTRLEQLAKQEKLNQYMQQKAGEFILPALKMEVDDYSKEGRKVEFQPEHTINCIGGLFEFMSKFFD
jgi:hypothetical protein